MIVYLLRHASAGEQMADAKKDEKRPLDEDGKLQSQYIGRALAAMDISPDLIISSPLTRAMQTASIVANELDYEAKIEITASMRPQATFEDFQAMLRKFARANSVIAVGHDPSITEFLGKLIGGRGAPARIDFKKGAVAKLDVRTRSATLQWLITPKFVRALQESFSKSSRPKTSRK